MAVNSNAGRSRLQELTNKRIGATDGASPSSTYTVSRDHDEIRIDWRRRHCRSVSSTTKLRQKFYAKVRRRSFHTGWTQIGLEQMLQ